MTDEAVPTSDTPPGPGYWKASDGNWYPPESLPASPVPPPPNYSAVYGSPVAGMAPSNGMATAAMVLGIVGICLFWLAGIGALLGILAVIFGAIGLSKANATPGQPLKGRAKAGLITGVVAIVAGVAFFALVVSAVDDLEDINTDPSDGFCNTDRFLQDPDC